MALRMSAKLAPGFKIQQLSAQGRGLSPFAELLHASSISILRKGFSDIWRRISVLSRAAQRQEALLLLSRH